MKSTIKNTVLTLALTLIASASFAQSATTSNAANNVSATVIKNCLIENFALGFGDYDPTSGTPTDATTNFRVRCTTGTVASIALSLGAFEAGTGVRKMANGANRLDYGLFTDAPGGTAWTPTAPKTYTATNAAWFTHTIHGRIPAEQDIPVGTYYDTVQATINF